MRAVGLEDDLLVLRTAGPSGAEDPYEAARESIAEVDPWLRLVERDLDADRALRLSSQSPERS